MKKKRFTSTVIFLLAITFVLFYNINQAKAQCNIVWWGDESGSVPTDETSLTDAAHYQAFIAIFGTEPDVCYGPFPELYLCGKGDGPLAPNSIMVASGSALNDGPSWVRNAGEGNIPPGIGGGWDVICSGPCEEAGGDSDSDGICDEIDQCIGTSLDDVVNEDGCSIDDMCECDNEWKNHGAYVKCVAQASEDFVDAGLISEDEKDDIVGEKASSDCGKLRSVRSDIREHLAAIEIWMEYDYASPNQPEDDDYHFGICFDADATVEKISFLTPAGNSYEFGAEIVDTSTGDGWLYSGREYDPENTFNYEWCYEREFNTTPSALDAFGDGTYTVTMYYENGSTDQTTAWFGIPGTNNPIVQPTEPPEFTNFEHGDTLVSPVTFEWDACSSPLNGTYFELEDIVEEEYPGCTVDSYGPLSLGVGSYNADLAFETWYDSVNGDGIDVGVGKGVESDYDFFVE